MPYGAPVGGGHTNRTRTRRSWKVHWVRQIGVWACCEESALFCVCLPTYIYLYHLLACVPPSVCLSVCLPTYIHTYLPACLPIYLSIYLSRTRIAIPLCNSVSRNPVIPTLIIIIQPRKCMLYLTNKCLSNSSLYSPVAAVRLMNSEANG